MSKGKKILTFFLIFSLLLGSNVNSILFFYKNFFVKEVSAAESYTYRTSGTWNVPDIVT